MQILTTEPVQREKTCKYVLWHFKREKKSNLSNRSNKLNEKIN